MTMDSLTMGRVGSDVSSQIVMKDVAWGIPQQQPLRALGLYDPGQIPSKIRMPT